MRGVFPVIFTLTRDNVTLVDVPDLEIVTEGVDLCDAIKMARDAIELKITCLEDNNEKIPQSTSISDIDISAGAFSKEGENIISLVDFDSNLYRRKMDNKRVRRNVSLPGWLNNAADEAGINVSRILQDALKEALDL